MKASFLIYTLISNESVIIVYQSTPDYEKLTIREPGLV